MVALQSPPDDQHECVDSRYGAGFGSHTRLVGFATRVARASELSAVHTGDFLVPHQKIEVAPGRSLNLFCMGSGKTTVLFEAGGGDWSVVWTLVQPRVARDTRACSYDRAG